MLQEYGEPAIGLLRRIFSRDGAPLPRRARSERTEWPPAGSITGGDAYGGERRSGFGTLPSPHRAPRRGSSTLHERHVRTTFPRGRPGLLAVQPPTRPSSAFPIPGPRHARDHGFSMRDRKSVVTEVDRRPYPEGEALVLSGWASRNAAKAGVTAVPTASDTLREELTLTDPKSAGPARLSRCRPHRRRVPAAGATQNFGGVRALASVMLRSGSISFLAPEFGRRHG
jgi:hypothetical protein